MQERIPIWVVGMWPRPKSMRRVLRCDGLVPAGDVDTPADIETVRDWLADNGARPDLDIVREGETPAHDPDAARSVVAPWEQAGSTWWLEARWDMPHHSAERLSQVRERLLAGPPRVS